MLYEHLEKGIRNHGDVPAVIHQDTVTTYSNLKERSIKLARDWSIWQGRRIGLRSSTPELMIAALVALDRLRAHGFLIGSHVSDEIPVLTETFLWAGSVQEEGGRNFICTTNDSANPPSEPGESGNITILTSGTTGTPKAISHSWSTLSRPVRYNATYVGTRWLQGYSMNLYAGMQVFLQSFLNWATLVVPSSSSPEDIARTLAEDRVEYASGTPTFWRQILFLPLAPY